MGKEKNDKANKEGARYQMIDANKIQFKEESNGKKYESELFSCPVCKAIILQPTTEIDKCYSCGNELRFNHIVNK